MQNVLNFHLFLYFLSLSPLLSFPPSFLPSFLFLSAKSLTMTWKGKVTQIIPWRPWFSSQICHWNKCEPGEVSFLWPSASSFVKWRVWTDQWFFRCCLREQSGGKKDHSWGIQSSLLSLIKEACFSSVLHRGRGSVIIVHLKKTKCSLCFLKTKY